MRNKINMTNHLCLSPKSNIQKTNLTWKDSHNHSSNPVHMYNYCAKQNKYLFLSKLIVINSIIVTFKLKG